jgi:hypothetical protein
VAIHGRGRQQHNGRAWRGTLAALHAGVRLPPSPPPLPPPPPAAAPRPASLAFVDSKAGGLTKRGTVELTLDGYSAPVSAGNFAANVVDGLYNNRWAGACPARRLRAPRLEAAGPRPSLNRTAYRPPPPPSPQPPASRLPSCLPAPTPPSPHASATRPAPPPPSPAPRARRSIQASGVSIIAAAEPSKQRPPIPLEIMPAGEFEPLYRRGPAARCAPPPRPARRPPWGPPPGPRGGTVA